MYAVTLAAAAVVDGRPLLVVIHAVLGVILGWVVAGAPQAFHIACIAYIYMSFLLLLSSSLCRRDDYKVLWCCAGVAFVPYAFYVLFAAPFGQAVGTAVITLLVTMAPMLITDRLFYGKWAVSAIFIFRAFWPVLLTLLDTRHPAHLGY